MDGAGGASSGKVSHGGGLRETESRGSVPMCDFPMIALGFGFERAACFAGSLRFRHVLEGVLYILGCWLPRCFRLPVLAGGVAMVVGAPALADTLTLSDGSRLQGTLVRMDATQVWFETAFAGELKIERAQVSGIETDSKVISELGDGSRLVGRLGYQPETGQQVRTELVGEVPVESTQLGAVWRPDQPAPEVLAMESAREEHRRELEELREKHREPHELWSGEVRVGMAGSDGNTDKNSMNGLVATKRETDFDRLELSLQGRSAEDQGQQTEAEVIGAASLERDFTERWFAFGNTSFERDRFEDMDLRSQLTSGLGYFLIRKPDHEWKSRAGLGYQFEVPENGPNEGEFILSLGYDYWIRLLSGTKVGHKFTYFPTIEQPGTDYRLESEFSVRHPISKDKALDIGFSLRHQYDGLPPVGVKKLDTQYNLNIGYTFE